jgi:hypothetical protein
MIAALRLGAVALLMACAVAGLAPMRSTRCATSSAT